MAELEAMLRDLEELKTEFDNLIRYDSEMYKKHLTWQMDATRFRIKLNLLQERLYAWEAEKIK